MRIEDLAFKPAKQLATDTKSGSAVSAVAAATSGFRHVVTGLTISFAAATTAAVVLTLSTNSAGTVLDTVNIPIGTILPIHIAYARALPGVLGADVTAAASGSHGAVNMTVNILGFDIKDS